MLARHTARNCILILIALAICGCESSEPAWNTGLHDLRNIPLSSDLKPALDDGIAALTEPEPDVASVRDHATFLRLLVEMRPLATREATADELYALWEAEPDNLLWLTVAFNNDHLFKRPDDLERMLAYPALNDTNTALGAYVAGKTTLKRSDAGRWYLKADLLPDELPPIPRCFLVLRLAEIDLAEGRFAAAIKRLTAGIPEARQAGGHAMEYTYWNTIARRLTAANRLDDALHAATLSAAHARVAGDLPRLLTGQTVIAAITAQRGEYAPALVRLEELARRGEELNYHWVIQQSLDKAAQISCEIGDYDNALRLDRRNLQHAQVMGDVVNIPRFLANIAHDHRMTGRLDSTFVYLQRAQEVVATTNVPKNRTKMAELLAEYYCQVGKYAVAESLLIVASELNAALRTKQGQATMLLALVPTALEMGRPDLAYEWLARIDPVNISWSQRADHTNFVADFEILSARLLADQGETRLAAEALARARRAVETGGGEGKRWLLEAQTGELALRRGDPRSAEQAFTVCLDISLQGQDPLKLARSRFQLGQFYLDQNSFGNAAAMFALLAHENTFGHAYRTGLTSLLLRGLTHVQQGQYNEAVRLYDTGLSRLNADSPTGLVLRFHLAKGRALTRLGQYRAAESELKGVVAALAQAPQLVPFDDLQVFHTDIERSAREALTDNLIAGSLVAPDRIGTATLEQIYPGLAVRLSTAGPTLVYFLGDAASWTWLVSDGRITMRPLPPRTELQEMVMPILVDLSQPGRAIDEVRLEKLAELLLGDLNAHWPTATPLTFVLDGILRQLPWATLPLPGSPEIVLERGPLQEIDPDRVLRGRKTPVTPQQLDLMAIGCNAPNAPGRPDLPDLRQAEAEAQHVHETWTGPGAELMIGSEANWAHLLERGLEQAGVIHLASHAEVNQGVSRRSTLRLTEQASDGTVISTPVTMMAVSRLTLRAELVYLSSCRAGLPAGGPNNSKGDFTSAFLDAGAHTVIASTQWVDDEAARHLADRFYQYWQSGAGKAAALQAARQDVRATWPHPAYWAFFRLTGDGS